MSLITLLNGSLQTVATGLVVFGAIQITEKADLVGGIVLLVFGLIAYVAYEKLPAK